MTSKEWLELLDTQILPYIGYYVENGKIDREWFTREENKLEDPVEDVKAIVKDTFEINNALAKEIGDVAIPELDEVVKQIEETENLQDNLHQENLQLEHGEETVLETNDEEVKEAQEHIDHAGETVVEEEPVQEQTQQ